MTTISSDRLNELLPVLHRLQDHEEGQPLQVLLRAIGEQAEILRQDVDRLWDDFFIETCRDWVVPYIGDLVANNLLHDAGARARVDVAKTIYYRRRKGTLPMLEELARDVTGWGGHAVEFFELLGWTQNLNHLRFQAGWPDLRNIDAMDRIEGPFDQVSHTVDVRPPSEGWHNIKNIGFFLYRLQSYPIHGTVLSDEGGAEHGIRPQPRVAGSPQLFHFSSLGAPAPLFNRWRREGDEAGLATEPFVPGPIRPIAFMRDLQQLDQAPSTALTYYGAASLAGSAFDECGAPATAALSGGSLAVFVDGLEIPAERILCKDLSSWQAPAAGSDTVAVDVALGRIAFAPDAIPESVGVEYHQGFSGDIGGGPYDRRRLSAEAGEFKDWGHDTVANPGAFGSDPITVAGATADYTTIQDAIDEWAAGVPSPTLPPAVIEVEDDRTYIEDLEIDVSVASKIVVQSANERRPTLVGTVTIIGDNPTARVVIDGFVIEGHITLEGNVAELRVAHCTLVPGRALDEDGRPTEPDQPSIVAQVSNEALQLRLYRSIVGALRLPEEMAGLVALQCVIDGLDSAAVALVGSDDEAGPPSDLRQVTIFGDVYLRSLAMASEVIFSAPVRVKRTQEGCVRFSYVAPGSSTPQRYRCQPDLATVGLGAAKTALVEASLRPAFTSIHYHDPGYTQLNVKCPAEIRMGAEDGAEMGVWAYLRIPQRETNLRIRLDEYLPFGLEPALIFVT